jgi:hypothetical protein
MCRPLAAKRKQPMHQCLPKRIPGLVKVLVLGMVLGWVACGNKSYINVTYHLPAATDTLPGRTVYIETRDLRSGTEIFNAAAKEHFNHFTGLFSLSIENGPDDRTVVGAYPLAQLFEATMKQRLARLGIQVADQPSAGVPTFQIKLNQFHINLVEQKWQADISYEANLSQDAQLVAREVVTGSAERMKVIGTGGAEKIVGEIFTDMINRLNIERLFQQAKL